MRIMLATRRFNGACGEITALALLLENSKIVEYEGTPDAIATSSLGRLIQRLQGKSGNRIHPAVMLD